MRSFFVRYPVWALFLVGCFDVDRAVRSLFHVVTTVVAIASFCFALGCAGQLVRERRAPKLRLYFPIPALLLILPFGLACAAFWTKGFAPEPWQLSSDDVPWILLGILSPVAVATALPFFSTRPARRTIWLVFGAHVVFGYVALVVHCISAGGPAFPETEIADVQAAGSLGCVLSKSGKLACRARWKMQLVDVQPLASMAVREGRVCGIGREHHTVWCTDLGDAGFGPFWKVEGIADAERLVLGPTYGCVVRRNQKVSCFGSERVEETHDAKDVAVGSNFICLVGTDDRATCKNLDLDVPDAKSVVAIGRSACALTISGEVVCTKGAPIATENLHGVDQITAGGSVVCVRTGGIVRCGGEGAQTGLGDYAERSDPQAVALPSSAVDVHATSTATCAKLADGSIYCWGLNTGLPLMTMEGESCGWILDSNWCTPRPARAHFD
jgi:hypothetical protein